MGYFLDGFGALCPFCVGPLQPGLRPLVLEGHRLRLFRVLVGFGIDHHRLQPGDAGFQRCDLFFGRRELFLPRFQFAGKFLPVFGLEPLALLLAERRLAVLPCGTAGRRTGVGAFGSRSTAFGLPLLVFLPKILWLPQYMHLYGQPLLVTIVVWFSVA